MNPTFELTPESARALAMRLYTKEQFVANPRACIISALDWLDRAAGDSAPVESSNSAIPARNALIERLNELVKIKGPETIAKAIGVSPGALRSWLRGGVQPTTANLKRIEQFLSSETSPPDVAGAEGSARSGELFARADQQPPGSAN
jgi:hypothetical protein